jgi:magnesium chelatase family protein
MDRFDLRVEVPPVAFTDLELPVSGERTAAVATRVAAARAAQDIRHPGALNADLVGAALDEVAAPDDEGRALLAQVADRIGLSARGYHRILRVARTIADLAGEEAVRRPHVAEAVSYRLAGASV